MRVARYGFAVGAQAARWPFAVPEVRMTPMIAPEFRASFGKILTTTRIYFDIGSGSSRGSRKQSSSGR